MSSPGPSPRSSTSKTNPKQHHDFSTWPPKPTTSTEANARRSTLKDIFPGATSRVGGPCESRKEVRMLALGMGVLPDPYASEESDEGGIEGFVIVDGGGSEDEDGGYRRTCMEVECSWEKEREDLRHVSEAFSQFSFRESRRPRRSTEERVSPMSPIHSRSRVFSDSQVSNKAPSFGPRDSHVASADGEDAWSTSVQGAESGESRSPERRAQEVLDEGTDGYDEKGEAKREAEACGKQ
ncbi:hypothetical protein LTR37_016039 [Vermiconidia calcicola]|uniref:Uncharacterized protein n=1 Tax=Vermiconidia calcicola TaxID=1690605 RepID=A0ACC3MQJ4_9PEZI|nr:hypothetical protein LTR37_016039 [Vermiconidia calcicola]